MTALTAIRRTVPLFAMAIFMILALTLTPNISQAQSTPSASSTVLIDLLKDDVAREALIADLERAATAAEIAATDTTPKASPGQRVAEFTKRLAESTVEQSVDVWGQVKASKAVFSGITGEEISVLKETVAELALLLVLTVGLFIAMRRMAIPLYRRMGEYAGHLGFIKTSLMVLASAVMDGLVVLIAWAIGYVITLTLIGDAGQIDLRQTLYLNAFLAVEMIKVFMRMVVSPSSGGLRMLPLSNGAAKSLAWHANILVSMLGYGQLLIVPIINQNVSFLAGKSISVMFSVLALIYLIALVMRKRKAVSHWMIGRLTAPAIEVLDADIIDDAGSPDMSLSVANEAPIARSSKLASLARHWHWGALSYLTVMFFIVMTRPAETVIAALQASGKVGAILIGASLLSNLLARTIARGIKVPADLNKKLPLLERRINNFVPRILQVLRIAMIAMVILFSVDAIGLIDGYAWLQSDIGKRLSSAAVTLFFIGAVSGAIWVSLNAWVDYRLSPEIGAIPTARETTLLTLMRNAAIIALLILTAMFCLSEIGLDIGPLLASAGVLGLAIGFGSQKMVQDIIGGVFIQFENAINVGDVITVSGITGTVEKLTVRSVSLRDYKGTYHIIPFSAVEAVSNFMRDFSYFVADMGVAYRENVEDVKQAMFDGFEELRLDPDHSPSLIGDMEWFGLNSFGDSAIVLRARIKTIPGKQWSVGRAYNGILKRIFDERNIEIPFPHQTIYLGEAKDGTTQAQSILESLAKGI